jgi:hypothetical protein
MKQTDFQGELGRLHSASFGWALWCRSANPTTCYFNRGRPHPVYCLPETDFTTFTSVIDAYIDATK